MEWLHTLFFGSGIAHAVLTFALVITIGILLGKVKIGGISLGITWILFVGIVLSHFGMTVDGEVYPQMSPEAALKLLEEIRNDALAKAPVQAGGSYRLDFTHHNGGPLVVRPAADAETVTGTFIKEPDKPEELHFTFGEQAYTCKVSGYTDTDDLRKTLFSVDLTEEYKQLYPDAGVTQVIRKEYTSHPY